MPTLSIFFGIVREWCLVHQAEPQDNWQRAQRFEPLDRIQGADRD